MIRDIIENGEEKEDRTGVGTLSKFGIQTRWNLENDEFPLLTTKKVYFKGIAEELFWLIKGDTNALHLNEKGIKIWNGNSSREYLDKLGFLDRDIGDLGPIYGFQWRHFGAKYKDMNTDYTNQGIDQLKQVIDLIQNDPSSRRIILTAWNPIDLSLMALPPCHIFCQFYVSKSKELSCQMYQRSGDMGLGVPFNIASYALLLRLIAQVTNLKPKELIHIIGDAHIYKNHIGPLKEQIQRKPRPFPKLKLNPKITKLEDFQFSDLELIDYNPYPSIVMEMAI